MNLIKSNEVTQNLFNSLKINYYNNILEIAMYNKLLSFTNEEVLLNDISIYGENLKVIYIDKFIIKVKGKITLVKGN